MLTVKQNLNFLSAKEYKILRYLCHTSKNLVNETLYTIKTRNKQGKSFLGKYDLIKEMKTSNNGKILQSNIAQQIIKSVHHMYSTFFALLKKKKNHIIDKEIKEPYYLDKSGYYPLIIQDMPVSLYKDHMFTIPYSRSFLNTHRSITIKLPLCLYGKTIREIRIVPKYNARIFEIHYAYIEDSKDIKNVSNLNRESALAIDLGVNNFATCVSTEGKSFIIDGKKIKSYNQWYNKQIAFLESIKFHQKIGVKFTTKQAKITIKRNRRISDYIYKASWYIIRYCLANNLGNIVVGFDPGIQRKAKLGHVNNQMFKQLPFGQFLKTLERLCNTFNINLKPIDESYTSKASFFDGDYIPNFSDKDSNLYKFSGKRVKRGLYKTLNGMCINADLNGALNIMKKSNVVPDAVIRLYNSGELNAPIRIRLHK